MRRIEGGVAAIMSAIVDELTFYNLSIAKRSVKPAIFHLSTISLICLFLITTMSPSLFLTDSSISTIYGQQSLTVRISSNDTEGVVPATFDFQADIIGGTRPYTISWDFGDGTEGSNEQTIEHTFEEAGTYNVTLAVTDNSNQNASNSIEITVGTVPPSPTVEIISSDTQGIASSTFDFEANVTGGTEPYAYSWDIGGDGTEDSKESRFSNTFEEVGSYNVTLTVTDSNGLTVFDDIAISVKEEGEELTTADFTVGITSRGMQDVVPAIFEFEANVTGGTEPYTYIWNLGDGTEGSNEQTIEHTFEEAGTYNVTLAVTDIDDHNESDSIVITVKEPPPPPPPPNGWIILLVVLASIVIGGIALGKYKMNRRSSRRIKIPPSAIVEITAKGGIDQ